MNSMKWLEKEKKLLLLDQRLLPHQENWIEINSMEEVCSAIKEMVVRGAPAISFTGLYGLILFCHSNAGTENNGNNIVDWDEFLNAALKIKKSRSTAVNLAFEIEKCVEHILKLYGAKSLLSVDTLSIELLKWTKKQISDLDSNNKYMSKLMFKELLLIKEKNKFKEDRSLKLMTHCNTGELACGTWGTALGAIKYGYEKSLVDFVWVNETRPYFQGSRLTSFELLNDKIPHNIVVEGSASYLMENKMVDAVLVGADRIFRNGDTINKIGTSSLAIIANYYKVPFFVLAPISSFDFNDRDQHSEKIELRDDKEILTYKEHLIASQNAKAFNPSFDITRKNLIDAIITEKGVYYPKTSSHEFLNIDI
jgi:methylthioribose-1-phosphate isomerase